MFKASPGTTKMPRPLPIRTSKQSLEMLTPNDDFTLGNFAGHAGGITVKVPLSLKQCGSLFH